MSKGKENSLVPELRFPEFKNQRTWQIKKLSEILFEHRSKSTGKEKVFSVSVHKGIINQIEHLGRSFSAANTDNYSLVLPGDLVYTKSPTGNFPYGIIKQSMQEKSVIVSPLYGIFTPETRDLGYILDAYFESQSNTFNYLAPIIQKGAKNTINIKNETFLSQSLNVPTDKEEQKKIADCILSLDQIIVLQKRKIDSLKKHKKGLIENLFPAEGEILPNFRFKEFKNDGVWREKTLKDVCRMQAGKFVNASEISENIADNLYPCYGGNGLRGYTKSFTHSGNYSLIGRQGALCGNVILVNQKFHATEHAVVVTPEKEINTVWLFYLLLYLNLNQYATGQAQPGLSVENLEKVVIKKPKSEGEQKKIADCLASLDSQIGVEVKKIEALKDHKRGLIQQLFPNVNEK